MKSQDYIVIAIDGPAGAGKSTIAKEVARRFSLLYIDSGAMYRAVAWKALKEKVDLSDEQAVAELAKALRIKLKPDRSITRVFADEEEITGEIRRPEITDASSKIATIGPVRETLVKQQQAMAREFGVVMEGRDIGTVVFPETPLKFYIDASPRERARRRRKDLEQAGFQVNLDDLEREVRDRDKRDSSRSESPLKRVEDAMYIDTTAMSAEEVVQAICDRIESVSGKAARQ